MSQPQYVLKPAVHAVQWKHDSCVLLDQRRLPAEECYTQCENFIQVVDAIKSLAVRGAPAIGVAAAYACVLAARQALEADKPFESFSAALETIASSRPTAVNLKWAVSRMAQVAGRVPSQFGPNTIQKLLNEAKKIHEEDLECSRTMAKIALPYIPEKSSVMTYCNAGDLATGGIGTALGVIANGFLAGKIKHVYVCETRPVLQGARLTAWELARRQIPHTLICDNMVASVMHHQKVDAVFVGADRIAANGDTANKIGTYGLAVLSKYHGVPFYVVAPSSTFDLSIQDSGGIPIEQRKAEEILSVLDGNQHPVLPDVYNPSFDATPAELIRAIICEKGIIDPVNETNVRLVLRHGEEAN